MTLKKRNLDKARNAIHGLEQREHKRVGGETMEIGAIISFYLPTIRDALDECADPWEVIREDMKHNMTVITKGFATEDNSVIYGLTEFKENGDMVHLADTGKGKHFVAVQYRTFESFTE